MRLCTRLALDHTSHACSHVCACVTHPYSRRGARYTRLHLPSSCFFFTSSFSSSSSSPYLPPRFLQLRCALFLLGATLSHLASLRRRAFSLGSLALLLSRYLGSDSICRTMLFTMWLHAGGPCSFVMLELRRRVSLQSTTLLGTQNASRRAPKCRLSRIIGAFSRIMISVNDHLNFILCSKWYCTKETN